MSGFFLVKSHFWIGRRCVAARGGLRAILLKVVLRADDQGLRRFHFHYPNIGKSQPPFTLFERYSFSRSVSREV